MSQHRLLTCEADYFSCAASRDYDKEFLLQLAVRDDCEADLDLYLPHSTRSGRDCLQSND